MRHYNTTQVRTEQNQSPVLPSLSDVTLLVTKALDTTRMWIMSR